MKDIFALTLDESSGEERLPGFSAEFPYLHSRAFLNRYVVPWHWHPALELFYVESGAMAYDVPGGSVRLPAGAGGLVRGGGAARGHKLSARRRIVFHDPRLQDDLRRVSVRVQPDEAGRVQHRAGSVAARRRGHPALRNIRRAHRRVVRLAGRLEHRSLRRRSSPPPRAEKRIRKTALSQNSFRLSAAFFVSFLIPDSRTSPTRARTERCPPRSPARYSP